MPIITRPEGLAIGYYSSRGRAGTGDDTLGRFGVRECNGRVLAYDISTCRIVTDVYRVCVSGDVPSRKDYTRLYQMHPDVIHVTITM